MLVRSHEANSFLFEFHFRPASNFDCLSCPDVGWALPTIPQSVVVGSAHPTKSQTVELDGACQEHFGPSVDVPVQPVHRMDNVMSRATFARP